MLGGLIEYPRDRMMKDLYTLYSRTKSIQRCKIFRSRKSATLQAIQYWPSEKKKCIHHLALLIIHILRGISSSLPPIIQLVTLICYVWRDYRLQHWYLDDNIAHLCMNERHHLPFNFSLSQIIYWYTWTVIGVHITHNSRFIYQK